MKPTMNVVKKSEIPASDEPIVANPWLLRRHMR
jgi:hypothetical protein